MQAETLTDRGEAGLIAAIMAAIGPPPPGALGVGDDAALIPWRARGLVATVDQLVEGVHFRRTTTSPQDLGHKALAVNLSDVAAMGATPVACLVGLAAPGDLEAAWVDGLYAGLAALATAHGVFVAGGDTTGSPGPVMIAVTLLAAPGPQLLTRDAGRAGDVLFVTGRPGRSAAGLALLETPTLATLLPPGEAGGLLDAHRRPVPQLAVGRAIAASGLRVALLDDSDGLGRSAQLLAAASGVDAVLDAAAVPLDPAMRSIACGLGRDPLQLALAGGEDFHLVGAVAARDWPALAAVVRHAGGEATAVGRLSAPAGAGPAARLDTGQGPPEVLAGEMGHAHFARTSFPPR